MDTRTTTTGRLGRSRRRPPAAGRRPGLYLGVATAGAVLVGVVVGTEPAAQAEAAPSETVSVAQELGLTAETAPVHAAGDLQPLQDLAATRSSREAAETAAQQAQAAADQAVLDRQRAEAEAAAKAKAEAEAAAKAAAEAAAARAAAAAAPAQAGEAAPAAAAPRASAAAAGTMARITNSAGPVAGVVQAAANAVVSNVPGADSITLGGTRPSAADPGGHPSGLALDYMVGSDAALGDAIVEYHIAHWDELGVDYVIWQQRMLSSPNGSWKAMADRGSATANHMDHPHVNYRG
jgi:nucleoid-associated protein YgaU